MRMDKIEIYEDEYITPTEMDDDEMVLIKEALKTLTPVQRKIYLTYVESGTYSDTAKQFGVSIPTVKGYLKKITDKIVKYVFENIS